MKLTTHMVLLVSEEEVHTDRGGGKEALPQKTSGEGW